MILREEEEEEKGDCVLGIVDGVNGGGRITGKLDCEYDAGESPADAGMEISMPDE